MEEGEPFNSTVLRELNLGWEKLDASFHGGGTVCWRVGSQVEKGKGENRWLMLLLSLLLLWERKECTIGGGEVKVW